MAEDRHLKGRRGDLEITEDLSFQRREWAAERIAWTVMVLLIAAALLGQFGTGPLSHTIAGEETGPLWLEYERFGRLLAPAELRLHLGAAAASDGMLRVWLDRRYLESVELQRVTPEPDGVEAGPDRLIFAFRLGDPQQPTAITFNMRPTRFGAQTGRAGLMGGTQIEFRQFVYP